MKVILVNGSPRINGCTDRALKEIADTLEKENIESEMFWIGNRAISGCLACGGCYQTKRCIIDDCVNEFIDKTVEADGFIFATPVHYASASGLMTSFMDRVFYAGNRDRERFFMKPGAVVVSARRAGTTSTFDQMNKYLSISQMPIVSSKYWNMVHGNTPAEVEQDLEGLQIMRTLARNMAFLLKSKAIALENGLELPEQEPSTPTNFIR